MLTAQLKCNPLYPTTWQNDRNITNQNGGGGSPGSQLRSRIIPVSPPPPEPCAGQTGEEVSACAVSGPAFLFFFFKAQFGGIPFVSMETL